MLMIEVHLPESSSCRCAVHPSADFVSELAVRARARGKMHKTAVILTPHSGRWQTSSAFVVTLAFAICSPTDSLSLGLQQQQLVYKHCLTHCHFVYPADQCANQITRANPVFLCDKMPRKVIFCSFPCVAASLPIVIKHCSSIQSQIAHENIGRSHEICSIRLCQ